MSSTPVDGAPQLFCVIVPFLLRLWSCSTEKCPPWCHCSLPEVEYPERRNVWVYTRREAPFRATSKAQETVAEGPRAQSEGTRGTS